VDIYEQFNKFYLDIKKLNNQNKIIGEKI